MMVNHDLSTAAETANIIILVDSANGDDPRDVGRAPCSVPSFIANGSDGKDAERFKPFTDGLKRSLVANQACGNVHDLNRRLSGDPSERQQESRKTRGSLGQ